jgi:hypothetical protein
LKKGFQLSHKTSIANFPVRPIHSITINSEIKAPNGIILLIPGKYGIENKDFENNN